MINKLFVICILSIGFARCNLDVSNIEFQKVSYKHCKDLNCSIEFSKKITKVHTIKKECLYYTTEKGSVTLGFLDKAKGIVTDATCEYKSEDEFFQLNQLFDEYQDGVHVTIGGIFTMLGSLLIFKIKRLVLHVCRKKRQKNEIRRLLHSKLLSHSDQSRFSQHQNQTHSNSESASPQSFQSFSRYNNNQSQATPYGNQNNIVSSTRNMTYNKSLSNDRDLIMTPISAANSSAFNYREIQEKSNKSKAKTRNILHNIQEVNETMVNEIFCLCNTKCRTKICPCYNMNLKCSTLCHQAKGNKKICKN
jgi:hypothetical protein